MKRPEEREPNTLEKLVLHKKWVITRGVQDPDFRTRIRQDSAHFEQTGSDQDYVFFKYQDKDFQISFLEFDANTIIKRIFAKI